jgi:adenylate cyclase
MGINVGDIIRDGRDIYGDGVNVAARLEALAEPGGICVSRVVRDQVRDKLDFSFEDMSEQQVKNIARPVRVHCIVVGGGVGPSEPSTRASAKPSLALPDKPSIAVLPFQNMSGDPDQEYFADGMVEDPYSPLTPGLVSVTMPMAHNDSVTVAGDMRKNISKCDAPHTLLIRAVISRPRFSDAAFAISDEDAHLTLRIKY